MSIENGVFKPALQRSAMSVSKWQLALSINTFATYLHLSWIDVSCIQPIAP